MIIMIIIFRLFPNLSSVSLTNYSRSESYLDGEDNLQYLQYFRYLRYVLRNSHSQIVLITTKHEF